MKTNQLTQFSLQLSHQLRYFTARLQQALQLGSLPSRLGQVVPKQLSPALQVSSQGWRWLNHSKGWILSGLGGWLLWVLLWQWLLALTVGLTVTVGCYLAQQGQLKSWLGWQWLWSQANRSLSLSALAGLVATGGTYLALAIWIELDRSWLASGLILEGFGLLAILSLLLWRQFSPEFSTKSRLGSQPEQLDYLNQLSAADPLQRLIAVCQLTRLAQQANPPLPPTHLSECFRLMLDREIEPLVCNALVEGLQQLKATQPLLRSQPVQLRTRSQPYS